METFEWYQSLNKPSFSPPSWLFGPVWTFLYLIILLSFGRIFYLAFKKQIPWAVALPFIINLIANLLFSPIQLGTRNFILASLDITLVAASLIWGMIRIWPISHLLAYVQIPYLLWVLFASLLQYSIALLN